MRDCCLFFRFWGRKRASDLLPVAFAIRMLSFIQSLFSFTLSYHFWFISWHHSESDLVGAMISSRISLRVPTGALHAFRLAR